MKEIIDKMKQTLINDETLTDDQIKALKDFIESWGNNHKTIENEIKKL